jgi:hypothetical protein
MTRAPLVHPRGDCSNCDARRRARPLSKTQRQVLAAAADGSLYAHARAESGDGAGFGWHGWNWGSAMEELDGRACRGLLLRGFIRQGPWMSSGDVALFVLTEAGRKEAKRG